jgi:hypothetical protein
MHHDAEHLKSLKLGANDVFYAPRQTILGLHLQSLEHLLSRERNCLGNSFERPLKSMAKHDDVHDASHTYQRRIKRGDIGGERRRKVGISGEFVGRTKLPLRLDIMVEHSGLQGLLAKNTFRKT